MFQFLYEMFAEYRITPMRYIELVPQLSVYLSSKKSNQLLNIYTHDM